MASESAMPYKLFSFISFADMTLTLKNNINARIRVNCIFFDIFTPPF